MSKQDGYLGFREGPAPLQLPSEERDGIPSCDAGCKVYSDGWAHYHTCKYVAWSRRPLDGEWQSERPEDGDWWLSVRPEVRAAACLGDVMPAMVRGSHVMPDRCGWYRLDSDIFTGALWQRRTVPEDPFAKGGR